MSALPCPPVSQALDPWVQDGGKAGGQSQHLVESSEVISLPPDGSQKALPRCSHHVAPEPLLWAERIPRPAALGQGHLPAARWVQRQLLAARLGEHHVFTGNGPLKRPENENCPS